MIASTVDVAAQSPHFHLVKCPKCVLGRERDGHHDILHDSDAKTVFIETEDFTSGREVGFDCFFNGYFDLSVRRRSRPRRLKCAVALLML